MSQNGFGGFTYPSICEMYPDPEDYQTAYKRMLGNLRYSTNTTYGLQTEKEKGHGMLLIPIKAIFNDPATIVYWIDGTKTVVKCQEPDVYDKHVGLAYCFAKKALGNKGAYNTYLDRMVRKWSE